MVGKKKSKVKLFFHRNLYTNWDVWFLWWFFRIDCQFLLFNYFFRLFFCAPRLVFLAIYIVYSMTKEALSADALEGGTEGIGEPEVSVTPRGKNKNNTNLLDTGIAQ